MNSTTKLLSTTARASLSLASRRAVSDIRINPKSVVYNGKTYTRMIYPYTMTARVINFPWAFEWQKNWHQRYLIYAFVLTYPLWIMIHNAVNSPDAKAAWAAKQKAEHDKAHKEPWDV